MYMRLVHLESGDFEVSYLFGKFYIFEPLYGGFLGKEMLHVQDFIMHIFSHEIQNMWSA